VSTVVLLRRIEAAFFVTMAEGGAEVLSDS
jgi:hypothetical protein